MRFLVLLVFVAVGVLAQEEQLPGDISELITKEKFESLFSNRNDPSCEGSFYTYEAFIEAASHFGGFGRTGEIKTRKREIAAFLAQTAYATGGKNDDQLEFSKWGYCHVVEQNATLDAYCIEDDVNFPCVATEKYYGRGPMQLRYNTYYGPAGLDLDYPSLLYEPSELERDATLSFKSALWYWMNCHSPKPSCHAVITNQWVPDSTDVEAGRVVAGFGITTNIIDGEFECGHVDSRELTRRLFFLYICESLDVDGAYALEGIDCETQQSYNYNSPDVTKIFQVE